MKETKKPRNPVARDLRTKIFRLRVVKSKKVYSCKRARAKGESSASLLL